MRLRSEARGCENWEEKKREMAVSSLMALTMMSLAACSSTPGAVLTGTPAAQPSGYVRVVKGGVHYQYSPTDCPWACAQKGYRMATVAEMLAFAESQKDDCAYAWVLDDANEYMVASAFPMYSNQTGTGCGPSSTGNVPRLVNLLPNQSWNQTCNNPNGNATQGCADCGCELGALEELPGFLGSTEIETPIPGHEGDQYWTDTDGVDPAVAGCHLPFSGQTEGACSGALAPAGLPGFGEFCNPPAGDAMHQANFPVGTLIETNPEEGVCHPHDDGLDHPYVFDCGAFCKGTQGKGHSGRCVADQCNYDSSIASARCECTAS